jgi:hypothetical protein
MSAQLTPTGDMETRIPLVRGYGVFGNWVGPTKDHTPKQVVIGSTGLPSTGYNLVRGMDPTRPETILFYLQYDYDGVHRIDGRLYLNPTNGNYEVYLDTPQTDEDLVGIVQYNLGS